MTDLPITVGLLLGGDPRLVEEMLGPLFKQMDPQDEVLVVILAGAADSEAVTDAVRGAVRGARPALEVGVLGYVPGPYPLAEARNRILSHAACGVVAFLEVGWVPTPRWVPAWRSTFRDDRIDAAAGAVPRHDADWERLTHPGAKIRWTGHVAARLDGDRPAPTSLADGRNFAVRLRSALEVGGFDLGFAPGRRYMDLEFFVRLAKAGGRMQYVPGAAAVESRSPRQGEPALDRALLAARWMAAIFARHEVWALLIMMTSHTLESLIAVLAGDLPYSTPGRVVRELLAGIRTGTRPVEGTVRPRQGVNR